MLRLFKALIFLGILSVLSAGAGLWWYAGRAIPLGRASVDFTIPPGSSMRTAARLAAASMPVYPDALVLLARITGRDTTSRQAVTKLKPAPHRWP